jgi:hypothetical protein
MSMEPTPPQISAQNRFLKRSTFFSVSIALVASITVSALGSVSANAADSFISIKWGKSIVGSGKIVEVVRTVPSFDQVVAKDGIRVILRQGAAQKITVKTDDNVEPFVETAVTGSTLTLRPKPNASLNIREAIIINVDYVQLNSLTTSDGVSADLDAVKGASFSARVSDGSALRVADVTANDFELKVNDGASATIAKVSGAGTHRYKISDAGNLSINAMVGGQVNASVSDGAKMTLRGVDLKSIDAQVSDGASASVEGVAAQQIFNVSDGASLDTQKLEGQSVRVRASDGGVVKLGKVQSLDVDARDGSVVRYSGEPTVMQKISDGAKLRKM